jgi:triosephosphate isomerase
MVRAKVTACRDHGLTPLVCVGEGTLGETEPVPVSDAVEQTSQELAHLLNESDPSAPLLVAYEPVWAIGAQQAASPDHVLEVAGALRSQLAGFPLARLIYGGTAGPGVFDELSTALDGLFLGRLAHRPESFFTTVSEVASA